MVPLSILYIGRLEEDTGLPVYLKALHLIKEAFPNARVEFLGDGELRNECEKYGTVKGFVKNPEKYMIEANFIFTSGYLSMLEALSLKKLVFATYDNPVKRSYLKDSPFSKYVITEKDPAVLAKKLLQLIKNSEKEKALILAGHAWAKKQTWKQVADLYLKLWSQ